MENPASMPAGTRAFPPPTRRLPGSACSPSRRPGDRRGGSVCAARVRVRVGPRRHARLRPPLGGVSWTGSENPYGPADVTPAPFGRRMAGGDRGQRCPLHPHTTPGTLSPPQRRTSFTSSRPKKAPLGTDPRGPGCGTERRGPCDRAGCGTLGGHYPYSRRPCLGDLTSPLPCGLVGSLPQLGCCGRLPCRVQREERREKLESPEVSPSRRGTPCWRAQQRRLKPAGRLKTSLALTARNPLPSTLPSPPRLSRVCVLVPLYGV